MSNFLKNENNYMPIIIATPDARAVATTIKILIEAAYEAKKTPLLLVLTQSALMNARQAGFEKLKEYFSKNPRGFIVDSDIEIISASKNLLYYIKKADKENCSFVSGYYTLQGITDIMLHYPSTVKPEEYIKIKDWEKIDVAGLGFYYGELPLSYKFKYDAQPDNKTGMGEDFYFFKDNKFNVKLAKNISLGHIKPASLIIPGNKIEELK